MQIRQVDIPWEVLEKVCRADKDAPETISSKEVDEAIAESELSVHQDKVLYHRLETNELADAITEGLELDDEDFREYNELVNEDHEETYFLLSYNLKKIQRAMRNKLATQGNTVYMVAPEFKAPFDEASLPDAWIANRDNPERVIKEVPDDRDTIYGTFENPDHPGLVKEKHVPLVRPDGSDGTIVFADNLSDMDDLYIIMNLDLKDGVKAIVDAMKACKHLHKLGKVHRDIKLDNIMIDRTGEEVKGLLCDHEFIIEEGTYAPGKRGTQEYMDLEWYKDAPLSRDIVQKGIDIFAFGITLLLLPIETEDRKKFLEELETEFSRRFSIALSDLLNKNPDIDPGSMSKDHPSYNEFLEKIAQFRLLNFDTVSLVKDMIKKLQPSTHVSEEVIVLIGKMLSYYRGDRPSLDQAIAILEKEYRL